MEYLDDNKTSQPSSEVGNRRKKLSSRNRKIIISISIVVLVISIGVASFYILRNKDISRNKQSIPIDSQNISSSSSDNQIIQQSDNKAIQKNNKAPHILYVYEQSLLDITKVYQSDISGQNKTEVDIGYADGFKFLASKDGKYLARWNNDRLEIASATKLTSFNKIAETSEPNTGLGNIIWSADSMKLAYIISKVLKPDEPFSPSEKKLYVINRDGTEQKLIKQFQEPNYVKLEGFNSLENEIYWFETGEGGFVRNFTVVNLTDGSIKEIKKDLDPGLDFSLNFTSDFSKAYYIKDNKIFEYTLSNNSKRILYELDKIGQDKYGNESDIDRLRLSPKNDLLVFARRTELDDKEITFSIALPGGKAETLLDDARYYNIEPFYWSPDGKYIWFETSCIGCGQESGYNNEGEYYLMNMETKNINLFFKGLKGEYEKTGKGLRMNEILKFIGWIAE